MKETFRIGLLRLLAFLAVNIFTYSMIVVARSLIFKNDGGVAAIALYMGVITVGLLIAWLFLDENRPVYIKIANSSAIKFFTFSLNITDKTRFIISTVMYMSLMLPFLAALLAYGGKGIFRASFEIVAVMIPYLVIIKNRYSGFSGIMNNRRSMTGFVLLLAALELAAMNESAVHLKPYLFIASYVYILLYLLLKNQEDIDDNIFDRKHIEKSILPRNLRSFNLKAVAVLFLIILLLFNLQTVVVWLIYMTGRLTYYFTLFLIWLSNVILPVGKGTGQAAQQQAPGLMGYIESDIHPWFNFIFNIVKYFILIYLFWGVLSFFIRKLAKLVVRLWKAFKKLISWEREERVRQSGDFDDEIEIVKPQGEQDRRYQLKKLLRHKSRDMKSITDPVERVRFIYASILEMLGIYGIKTEKSDTTVEILDKAMSINGIKTPLNEVTQVYNGVRYGSRIPDHGELLRVEENYRETFELLKH